MFHLPEGAFPVQGTLGAVTANAGVTLDNISMKNAQMVYMVFHICSGTGHPIAYTPLVGTSVATCATALPNAVPIWYGDVSVTSTQLTRQADAKLHTTAATASLTSFLIFQIDPTSLGSTYDCLGGTVANATHADYLFSCVYWIVPRYASKVSSMTATEYIVD
jgi:hypothetical protein